MKLLFLLLFSSLSLPALADIPATHGMVVFGKSQTYASHLPMFHSPHDYQLVLKIKLSDPLPKVSAVQQYKLLQEKGESLFTIAPDVMDLTEIMSGKKTQFGATLFVGHFEKDGKELGPVTVDIESIVFQKKLNPQQPTSGLSSYLIFGTSFETFMIHLIAGKPSFDWISQVSFPETKGPPCPRCNPSEDLGVILKKQVDLPFGKVPKEMDWIQVPGRTETHIKKVIYTDEADLSH